MDEVIDHRDRRFPPWYWLVAVAALLFELAGSYAYYLQMTTDPAGLPVDQRALIQSTPVWINAAYGLAVLAGVIGAVGLLQRRRFATGALGLSLAMVFVQFGGIMLVPALRQSIPSDQLLGPIVIFLLAYGFWQFARAAARRGWLH